MSDNSYPCSCGRVFNHQNSLERHCSVTGHSADVARDVYAQAMETLLAKAREQEEYERAFYQPQALGMVTTALRFLGLR